MKKQFKIALWVIVFSLPYLTASAFEVSVSAKLDSLEMYIGQQQKLRLEVAQPEGVHVSFPIFENTIIPDVEIVETLPMDTVKHGDRISVIQDYVITSYDSGFYYFDPIEFQAEGISDLKTEPMVLKVYTIPVDPEKPIKDIKAPLGLKYEFREILPWLIGAFILVVVVVLIIWLFRQLARKEPIMPFSKPKPVEPPHVIALRELNALKEEKLWQTDRVKEFYTRLTDTLRVYIEGRFKVAALEQTSDEILLSLKGELSDSDSAMQSLKQILSIADLVKFAKVKPLPNENDLCMMNSILFVEQTRPVEVKSIEELKKEMENSDKKDQYTQSDLKE